jgi:CRP-like cAMP-binding protein
VLSLLHLTASGTTSEIAKIGNEGVAGVTVLVGSERSPCRAVVQSGGFALRLRAAALIREFNELSFLQQMLLRYIQGTLAQMAQIALCNRHHTVEQQLCRWLLLSLDRVQAPQLEVTQEAIASMLGVRREGVTEAAGRLRTAGILEYARGRITVLDRARLERRACECYAAVKLELDRLLLPEHLSPRRW